jgi:hypothetical protein
MSGKNFTIYKDDLFIKVRNTHPVLEPEVNLFGSNLGIEPNPATPPPTVFPASSVSGQSSFNNMVTANGKFYISDYFGNRIQVVDSLSETELTAITNAGISASIYVNTGALLTDPTRNLLLNLGIDAGVSTPNLNVYSTSDESLIASIDLSLYPQCVGGAIDISNGFFYTFDTSTLRIVKIDYVNQVIDSVSSAFTNTLDFPIYYSGNIYFINNTAQNVIKVDTTTLIQSSSYSVGASSGKISIDPKYENIYISSTTTIILNLNLSFIFDTGEPLSIPEFNEDDDYVYFVNASDNSLEIRSMVDFSVVRNGITTLEGVNVAFRAVSYNTIDNKLYVTLTNLDNTAPYMYVMSSDASTIYSFFFDLGASGTRYFVLDEELGKYLTSGLSAGQGQYIIQGGWRASISGSSSITLMFNQVAVEAIQTNCIHMDLMSENQFNKNLNYTYQHTTGKFETSQIDPSLYRVALSKNGVIMLKDIKYIFDGKTFMNFTLATESNVFVKMWYTATQNILIPNKSNS